MIILSKHIIALLIHILLSVSVLIKGEGPVERYHARWLQIGDNQAKIKGRLCYRVSPFAWIRLVSWSGLGVGVKGEKRMETGVDGCGSSAFLQRRITVSFPNLLN